MNHVKTKLIGGESPSDAYGFSGLLEGLEAGPVLSWGLLEVVSLRRANGSESGTCDQFAAPDESLKLVSVPTYGTVVFRNTSRFDRLIVPMHVGFFQPGAQNHATSRVLVLEAGETLKVDDCFCVQASQGGLLQEAEQRFLMLPLGLRQQALAKRFTAGYSRLWDDIDGYTRHHGVATGGHLERVLRPNFRHLLPLRHAFESVDGQIGAAYFIAGKLAGVEVVPNGDYWHQLSPILLMYCYGPAALLAQRRGHTRIPEPLDLDGLCGLEDLSDRLHADRTREATRRAVIVEDLANLLFDQHIDEDRHGLRVATLSEKPWIGQVVRDGRQNVYVSVFRDVVDGLGTGSKAK